MPAPQARWGWTAFFAGAGALSFVAQAVLFREQLVLYEGGDLAVGTFFGSWLMWVGAGALAGRALLERYPRVTERLVPLGWLYALAPFAQLAMMRGLRAAVGVPAWQVFPLDALLALTTVANAPVSLLTGLLFTLASGARRRATPSASVSANYLIECLGSFAGGVAVTALVMRGLPAVTLLTLGAATMLAATTALATRTAPRWARISGLLVIGAAAFGWWGAGPAERALERARWRGTLPAGELVASCQTPYRQVAIGRLRPNRAASGAPRSAEAAGPIPEQGVVAFDGRIVAALPDEEGRRREAALVMTQHPSAARVLLLGEGATGLLRQLLAWGPREVWWVDPDPQATACLRPHLPLADRDALDDPRLRVVVGDERAGLRTVPAGLDLIAVLPADPTTAHGNRLYTQEFYREAALRLAPTGVLVTRVGSEANFLGPAALTHGASVAHTLRAVFAQVFASPGEEMWLAAGGPSATPSADGAVLAARLRASGRERPGLEAETLADLWPAERTRRLAQQQAQAASDDPEGLLNTDARPLAPLHGLMRQLATMGHGGGPTLLAARRAGAWLWWIALIALLALRLWRARTTMSGRGSRQRRLARVAVGNATALAGLAGGVSMALATLWMLAFQTRVGGLFEQVGLMSGLLVLGLALGGLAALRAPDGRWTRAVTLALPAAAAGATPLLQAWLAVASLQWAVWGFAAVFLGVGLACGPLLPFAERVLSASGREVAEVASRLEAADHLGGAMAAALVGALWVPLMGSTQTSALLLGASGAVALLFAQQRWYQRASVQPDAAPRPTSGGPRKRRRAARPVLPWGLGPALFALSLAAIGCGALLRTSLERPQTRLSTETLRGQVVGSVYEARSAPFAHVAVDPAAGLPPRAAIAASAAVAPEVHGYAGPLNLLVAVDATGRLAAVSVLQMRDTPAYVAGLGAWLGGLKGRAVDRPLRPRRPADAPDGGPGEVDVLTGATVSSQAALDAINRTASALATGVLSLPAPADTRGGGAGLRSPWAGLAQVEVHYLWLAMLLAVVITRWGSERVRQLSLALHVVVGGLLLNTQLSTVDLARVVRLEAPGPQTGAVFALFFGALTLAVLFGPLYCAGVCPFGAAQELLSRLGAAGRLHPRLEDGLRGLKFGLLAILVGVLAFSSGEELLTLDPLSAGLGVDASPGWRVALLLIAAGSLIVFRPWCRYLCPVGAALNLFNRVRLLGALQRPRAYGACDLGVDGPADVDCLQCDRCIRVPSGASPRGAGPPDPRGPRPAPRAAGPGEEAAGGRPLVDEGAAARPDDSPRPEAP